MNPTHRDSARQPRGTDRITLFLCGDVMTGRGIDQILPHPSDPITHEGYMKDVRGYVALAERVSGPIPRSVDPAYVWGDALEELESVAPDLRIINLETSVTQSDDDWEEKEVHYRMHPENIGCLTAARTDVCALANNHILDWGYTGLQETLETLREAKIRGIGAGMGLKEAESPAVVEIEGKGRVVIFAFGSPTSGIPLSWAASEKRPGVNLLQDLSDETAWRIRQRVHEAKQPGYIVIASIHWGGNWGYDVPREEIEFAHHLIDVTGVDIVHGHSSHHVKGIEVYRDRLILYGCGDFLNDYEGIEGCEEFRDDLGLMYFASVDPLTGGLIQLQMTPTRVKYFKVNRAPEDDALWLANILNRKGRRFETRVKWGRAHRLTLLWDQPPQGARNSAGCGRGQGVEKGASAE